MALIALILLSSSIDIDGVAVEIETGWAVAAVSTN
jgi:hypothetical protein